MNSSVKIALIGSGALALELLEMFGRERFVAAYCDPQFVAAARIDLPLHTSLSALAQVATHYVLALADAADRTRLEQALQSAGMQPAPALILPSAVLSPSATIGAGSVIGHGVQIGSRCRVGQHNFVMHHAVMGHDSCTGDHVVLCPGVFVSGYVTLENAVTVQANAALAKGITIGEAALIAQGASCFRSVPAGMQAIGNPARIIPPASQAPIWEIS